MADQVQYVEQLEQDLEVVKRQYSDMLAASKVQMNQTLANSDITKAKKELRKKRAACVELSNERDALLDRIADLERASKPDTVLATRRGTERDVRLRERLLPALNEPLRLDDASPYQTSRHCGPEVVQKHNYLAAQQFAQYEQQQGLPKQEPQRDIVKLPKGSRARKPAPSSGNGGPNNVAGTAGASSNPSFSNSTLQMETDAQIHHPTGTTTAAVNTHPSRNIGHVRVGNDNNNNDGRSEVGPEGEVSVNEDLLPDGKMGYAVTQGGISREGIMES